MIRFLLLLSFLSSIHAFSQENNQLSSQKKLSIRDGEILKLPNYFRPQLLHI